MTPASSPLALAVDTFGRMSVAARLALLRVYEARRPLVPEEGEAPDLRGLHDLGLLVSLDCFGARFWMPSAFGHRVIGHCLEWRDGIVRVGAALARVPA